MDAAIRSLRGIPSRAGVEVSTARATPPMSRGWLGLDLGGRRSGKAGYVGQGLNKSSGEGKGWLQHRCSSKQLGSHHAKTSSSLGTAQ